MAAEFRHDRIVPYRADDPHPRPQTGCRHAGIGRHPTDGGGHCRGGVLARVSRKRRHLEDQVLADMTHAQDGHRCDGRLAHGDGIGDGDGVGVEEFRSRSIGRSGGSPPRIWHHARPAQGPSRAPRPLRVF